MDNNFLHFFSEPVHRVMILFSLVPMAANTVAYAALLKVQPAKAAMAVFLSTIFALFYIPFIASIIF